MLVSPLGSLTIAKFNGVSVHCFVIALFFSFVRILLLTVRILLQNNSGNWAPASAIVSQARPNKWVGPARLLQPLEDIIRMKLIPVLTDRAPPNDVERNLFALPARLGGIAVANPATDTESIFSASTRISEPLKDAILAKSPVYSYDVG